MWRAWLLAKVLYLFQLGPVEAPRKTIKLAKQLRRQMSPAEARLWSALRGRAADGLRFRRQHPIGPYVLDFYCDSARLAVEVDGYAHLMGDRPKRDGRRDAWLAERGIRTLRIDAREVRDGLDGVVGMIVTWARARQDA
jgi:very-short-patch-repair endonuclease